ncbi:hypothetical protein VE04_10234, partial [Pseudogymnoascus sp. 24MN13]
MDTMDTMSEQHVMRILPFEIDNFNVSAYAQEMMGTTLQEDQVERDDGYLRFHWLSEAEFPVLIYDSANSGPVKGQEIAMAGA